MKFFITAILFVLLTSLAQADSSMALSKKDYGKKWPFSIDTGAVKCIPVTDDDDAIVFIAEGKTYAVNGIAKGRAKAYGFSDVRTIWLDDPGFENFVKEAAKAEGVSVEKARKLMGSPTKVNISPVINAGLKLCK